MKRFWYFFLLIPILGLLLYGNVAQSVSPAYLKAIPYRAGFLAVGTGGRADMIDLSGSCQTLDTAESCTLLGAASDGDTALVVGEGGTALLLKNGTKFSKLNTGTAKKLYTACFFNGKWLIGGEGGTLLKSEDLRLWKSAGPTVSGVVVGLASNGERCIGVTDRGEIMTSTDGANWSILNYSEYYGGDISFAGIQNCDGIFWAWGVNTEGSSEVITSVEGGVWSSRSLDIVTPNSEINLSQKNLTALCGDGQQVIAVFSDGSGLTLPSCSECNKLLELGDTPLCAVASANGKVLFAGGGYFFRLEDTNAVRQTRIKSEAALEKQKNGAMVIDVRSSEDYTRKHITGSVHLDVDQVAKGLTALVPNRNRELIFYCASGVRSQRALEAAQKMGYSNVYNLGGLNDWTYTFEGTDVSP